MGDKTRTLETDSLSLHISKTSQWQDFQRAYIYQGICTYELASAYESLGFHILFYKQNLKNALAPYSMSKYSVAGVTKDIISIMKNTSDIRPVGLNQSAVLFVMNGITAELQNIARVILKDTDSSKSVLVLDLSNKVKNLMKILNRKLMIAIITDIAIE